MSDRADVREKVPLLKKSVGKPAVASAPALGDSGDGGLIDRDGRQALSPVVTARVPEFLELWNEVLCLSRQEWFLLVVAFNLRASVGSAGDVFKQLRSMGVFTRDNVRPVYEMFKELGTCELENWFLKLQTYKSGHQGQPDSQIRKKNMPFVRTYRLASQHIDATVLEELKIYFGEQHKPFSIPYETVDDALELFRTAGLFCVEDPMPLVKALEMCATSKNSWWLQSMRGALGSTQTIQTGQNRVEQAPLEHRAEAPVVADSTGAEDRWFDAERFHVVDVAELEFDECIGTGKSRSVSKGKLLIGDDVVAIKRMKKEEPLKTMILREAGILLKIHNPYVVSLIAVAEDKEYVYLVMEYCVHGDLQHLAEMDERELPEKFRDSRELMFVSLLLDAFRGVKFVHGAGIFQRDIKAANILVTEDQSGNVVAKIGDFCFSRPEIDPENELSQSVVRGTPATMAAEAWSGQVRKSVDIFALGIVVWQVFEQKASWFPPGVRNQADAKRAVLGGTLPKFDKTPADLASVARSCWEEKPDDRSTIDDLVAMVQQVISTRHAAERRRLLSLPTVVTGLSKILSPNMRELSTAAGGARNPGTLLNARYGVVPFFEEARQKELDDLKKWCGEGNCTRVRLLHGPGGAGKTRLLIEWARRLREHEGWQAGFLETFYDEDVELVLTSAYATLVVVDYAESHPNLLSFLKRVARRPPAQTALLRIVLLAREEGDWWRSLLKVNEAVDSLLRSEGPTVRLEPISVEGELRKRVCQHACDAFAKNSGRVADVGNLDLGDSRYSRMLYLHMAALAVTERLPETDVSLLERIVDHERHMWVNKFAEETLNDSEQIEFVDCAARTVAALTLLGGVSSNEVAADLNGRVDGPGPLLHVVPKRFVRFLHGLYPGGQDREEKRYVSGLEPELLGEALVAQVLLDDNTPSDYLDQVFKGAGEAAIRSGFITLGRISVRQERPDGKWLREVLRADALGRARPAFQACLALGVESAVVPLGQELAAVLAELAEDGTDKLAAEFVSLLPEHTVCLLEVGVWATERLLEVDKISQVQKARLLITFCKRW